MPSTSTTTMHDDLLGRPNSAATSPRWLPSTITAAHPDGIRKRGGACEPAVCPAGRSCGRGRPAAQVFTSASAARPGSDGKQFRLSAHLSKHELPLKKCSIFPSRCPTARTPCPWMTRPGRLVRLRPRVSISQQPSYRALAAKQQQQPGCCSCFFQQI